jgi:branched-subunit amino acid permease
MDENIVVVVAAFFSLFFGANLILPTHTQVLAMCID